MKLVKLNDNTSLVITKIEEQTPLKASLEKKISKKQEDINSLKKALKTLDKALDSSYTKGEVMEGKSNNRVVAFCMFLGFLYWMFSGFKASGFIIGMIIALGASAVSGLLLKPIIETRPNSKILKLFGYTNLTGVVSQITVNEKEKKSLVKKINNATKALDKFQEEFSILSNNIYSLQTKKEVIESVIPINKIYDADDNNDLDVAETSNIELIIKQKQSAIRKIEKQENRNYLRDFTKINIFLDSFQKQLVNDYEDIQSFCEIENKISLSSAQQKIETFENNITSYKALMSSLVLMVSNLVNDDLVSFFKLYDIFDKLSVFESNYEKKVVQGFRDNADLTKQLIKATHNSRDVIERALDEVGYQVNAVQFELEWLGTAVK
tara:strand:+ start:107 stop:1246 length:1140 start_codon:yes stop_codon:yes gene_type:complete